MNIKDYRKMLKDKVMMRAWEIYNASTDKLLSEAAIEALIEHLPESVLKKVK